LEQFQTIDKFLVSNTKFGKNLKYGDQTKSWWKKNKTILSLLFLSINFITFFFEKEKLPF